jgi:uncharacterized membrane protein YbhN (UPF0104 family)
MTQRQQGTSSQRLAELMEVGATLPYQDAPTGAVVASDAALEALRKTRPWAMGFAVLLFAYAAAGGAVGAGWLGILVYRLFAGPPPTRPFINVASINLLFAPIALAGGLLAVAYFRAAGRAFWRRSSDDLERASVALRRLWLWGGVATIVLIAFPVCMILVAMFVTHDWPG